jgi:hypothetical protein
MGEQNEFGQGPGVDLTQGGTFTPSTEYIHDRSYSPRPLSQWTIPVFDFLSLSIVQQGYCRPGSP